MDNNTAISKKVFRLERQTFSGMAVFVHWKDYFHVYRGLGGVYMCKDLLLNSRKRYVRWKNKKRLIHKKKYHPVNIKEYAKWVDYLHHSKNEFVSFTKHPYERHPYDPKIYAFYLTQFHAIPENDHAHGKGFTEWTNVANATPQFVGHYQPKIPYDLGFYNLLMPDVMKRQVEIAKAYGVYGFCFYYYWFSGKKLLEKPLEYFLHSDIDFHFHLCWATENWSKRWDGGENEIIMEQQLNMNDTERFFNDLLPYISDPRYEKINGKPLLIIYRVDMFEKELFNDFVDKINNLAIKNGFEGLYLLCTNAFDYTKTIGYNVQGLVEFPPHGLPNEKYVNKCPRLSRYANFSIINMSNCIKDGVHLNTPDQVSFRTCFPEWDNTPRKAYTKGLCYTMQPSDFAKWLSDNILWTREHHKRNEQIVYINAWNEWGEGAILEPTTHYGYRNLQVVKEVLESTRDLNVTTTNNLTSCYP